MLYSTVLLARQGFSFDIFFYFETQTKQILNFFNYPAIHILRQIHTLFRGKHEDRMHRIDLN